jgi:hypothetical protein
LYYITSKRTYNNNITSSSPPAEMPEVFYFNTLNMKFDTMILTICLMTLFSVLLFFKRKSDIVKADKAFKEKLEERVR